MKKLFLLIFFITNTGHALTPVHDINKIASNVYNVTDTIWIAQLQNAYIAPAAGGTIFNSQFQYNTANFRSISDIIKNLPTITYDKLASFVQKVSDTYYYFMSNILPRIVFLEKVLKQYIDIKLLIPESLYKFFFEFLPMLGIDKDRIVSADPNYNYQANNLYVPAPVVQETLTPDVLLPLRDRLLKIVSEKVKNNQEKDLIVLVKHDKDHVIANHEILAKTLRSKFKKLSKKIVVCDNNMSALNQLDLFSRARVIIAPNSDILTNTIVSPNNVNIIEFFPNKNVNIKFVHLSQVLKHNHKVLRYKNGLNIDVNNTCNLVGNILGK